MPDLVVALPSAFANRQGAIADRQSERSDRLERSAVFMRLRVVLALLLVPTLVSAQGAAPLLPGERATTVTAIPGIIAADARWELIWADFETADGIVGTADGGVLFAQEQTDTIRGST
jgi:hypothetical protein